MSNQNKKNKVVKTALDDILKLKVITHEDTAKLSRKEKDEFYVIMHDKLNNTNGIEKDEFLEQVLPITPHDVHVQLYENNHLLITHALSKLTQANGRIPSQTDIANETKLSRNTVRKHLKEFSTNDLYLADTQKMQLLVPKLLARLYEMGIQGDVSACKLFLNMVVGGVGNLANSHTFNTQNNITINNTVLSQEKLNQLDAKQLNQIESIIIGE